MVQIGNLPPTQTRLRLARAKSFALGVFITDNNGLPLDITGALITLVAKPEPFDSSPNILVNGTAIMEDPLIGYCRFALQASDFDEPAGEYPFVMTMVHDSYSGVLLQGTLELVDNPDTTTTGTYSDSGV